MNLSHKAHFGPATIDAKKRQVSAVISDESVDADNEVVIQSKLRTDKFLAGSRPVLVDHKRGVDNIVGRVVDLIPGESKTEAVIQFLPIGISQLADRVYSMVEGGFLKSVSIGFKARNSYLLPKKGKNVTGIEADLYEVSFVDIPANAGAGVKADQEPNQYTFEDLLTAYKAGQADANNLNKN